MPLFIIPWKFNRNTVSLLRFFLYCTNCKFQMILNKQFAHYLLVWVHIQSCFFLKLESHSFAFLCYFLNYILLFMLLQPSQFPPPFVPLHPVLPTTSANPHTVGHAHRLCIYVLWLLYSLCCTLYPHDYSVSTNLYFLIPSHCSPIPWCHSHLATIKMFSISMILLLFCLFV